MAKNAIGLSVLYKVLAYSHILYLVLDEEDAVAVIDTRSKQRFNIRMLIHSGG